MNAFTTVFSYIYSINWTTLYSIQIEDVSTGVTMLHCFGHLNARNIMDGTIIIIKKNKAMKSGSGLSIGSTVCTTRSM